MDDVPDRRDDDVTDTDEPRRRRSSPAPPPTASASSAPKPAGEATSVLPAVTGRTPRRRRPEAGTELAGRRRW